VTGVSQPFLPRETPKVIKSVIIPTYALYSLNHVIHPYICFGLLKAILRGSKYLNIDYIGHTQKNGAVLIMFTIKTAPFFCVCPVYDTGN
jgi:hypothetical protein